MNLRMLEKDYYTLGLATVRIQIKCAPQKESFKLFGLQKFLLQEEAQVAAWDPQSYKSGLP